MSRSYGDLMAAAREQYRSCLERGGDIGTEAFIVTERERMVLLDNIRRLGPVYLASQDIRDIRILGMRLAVRSEKDPSFRRLLDRLGF